MRKHQIISAAQEVVRASNRFVLATVDKEGNPQMRWMGGPALFEEPLAVYMATGARSRKVAQIKAHPNSQLMFQTQDCSRVATFSGTCELVGDVKTKRRIWDATPGLRSYFAGPEDPSFAVIKFVCRRVEILGPEKGMPPAVAEV